MGRGDNERPRGQGRRGAALRRAHFQDTVGQFGEFRDCGGVRASKVGPGGSGHSHGLESASIIGTIKTKSL